MILRQKEVRAVTILPTTVCLDNATCGSFFFFLADRCMGKLSAAAAYETWVAESNSSLLITPTCVTPYYQYG
jgi:hypothetical protein